MLVMATYTWFSMAPRVAAVTHPQVSLAVVGATGHEQDVGAALAQHAGEFRKLDVVANLDGDLAVRHLEQRELAARGRVPVVLLPARAVQLVRADDEKAHLHRVIAA